MKTIRMKQVRCCFINYFYSLCYTVTVKIWGLALYLRLCWLLEEEFPRYTTKELRDHFERTIEEAAPHKPIKVSFSVSLELDIFKIWKDKTISYV